MLNTIKSIINQKKAYLESAELLLEDTELDDSIVLDESPMEIPPKEDTEGEAPEERIGAEEQPLPMNDDLPTPAAEPIGEPVSDDSVDLMTAEIDLATNTQTDILPIPPANAGDAIDGEGDIMSQTVDSGFGNDEDKPAIVNTADIMENPVDEPEVKATDDNNREDLDVNTPVGESNGESDDDDIMKEAVDDNKIEKSIEEKEKNYTKSYKESEDLMDAPIDEAVDDKKIEKSIESKEKEYNKSYNESDDADDGDLLDEPIDESSDDSDDADLLDTPIEEAVDDDKIKRSIEEKEKNYLKSYKESYDDIFSEAISLGDDTSGDPGTDPSVDVSPDSSSDTSDSSAASAEDNAVTSAVKDKVDELSSTDDYSADSTATNKEELMKKLSSLTKSIEDAKALVLKGLQ